MNRGIIPKKIVSTYLKSPDLSYLRFELREGALAFFAGLVLVAPFFLRVVFCDFSPLVLALLALRVRGTVLLAEGAVVLAPFVAALAGAVLVGADLVVFFVSLDSATRFKGADLAFEPDAAIGAFFVAISVFLEAIVVLEGSALIFFVDGNGVTFS